MSLQLRLFGKNLDLPGSESGPWSFEARPGGWMIATSPEGKRVRFIYQKSASARGQTPSSILCEGLLWQGQWVRPKPGGQAGGGGSDADLDAQFPGKVRKVMVSVGSDVSEGDTLVLLEAMKMEFAVKAPYAGKVSKLNVVEGQQLSAGERILEIAAQKKGA